MMGEQYSFRRGLQGARGRGMEYMESIDVVVLIDIYGDGSDDS